MTRLIGRRCKHSNVFSLPVLIGRGLGEQAVRARYGSLGEQVPVRPASRGRERPAVGFPGDHSGGATPVPIPNTEVKPASADGTWGAAPWESRTSPGVFGARPVPVGHGPC